MKRAGKLIFSIVLTCAALLYAWAGPRMLSAYSETKSSAPAAETAVTVTASPSAGPSSTPSVQAEQEWVIDSADLSATVASVNGRAVLRSLRDKNAAFEWITEEQVLFSPIYYQNAEDSAIHEITWRFDSVNQYGNEDERTLVLLFESEDGTLRMVSSWQIYQSMHVLYHYIAITNLSSTGVTVFSDPVPSILSEQILDGSSTASNAFHQDRKFYMVFADREKARTAESEENHRHGLFWGYEKAYNPIGAQKPPELTVPAKDTIQAPGIFFGTYSGSKENGSLLLKQWLSFHAPAALFDCTQAVGQKQSALELRKYFYQLSYFYPSTQISCSYESLSAGTTQDAPLYAMRSCMMGNVKEVAGSTAGYASVIKDELQLYQTVIQPYIQNAALYHVLPEPDGGGWDGCAYYDSENARGILFVFRPESERDTEIVKLIGLDPNVTYRVRSQDNENYLLHITGAALMESGLSLSLANVFDSDIIYFEKVSTEVTPAPGFLTGNNSEMKIYILAAVVAVVLLGVTVVFLSMKAAESGRS